jgi:hypothetical protein
MILILLFIIERVRMVSGPGLEHLPLCLVLEV